MQDYQAGSGQHSEEFRRSGPHAQSPFGTPNARTTAARGFSRPTKSDVEKSMDLGLYLLSSYELRDFA